MGHNKRKPTELLTTLTRLAGWPRGWPRGTNAQIACGRTFAAMAVAVKVERKQLHQSEFSPNRKYAGAQLLTMAENNT